MDAEANFTKKDMVVITVGEKNFQCDKTNLLQCSDYFKAMFTSNMTESITNTVTLHDTSAASFSVLMDYVETQKLCYNSDNIMGILESACMFQFTQVIIQCEDFVIKELSHDNCLQTMCFAKSHGLENLYKISWNMSLWNADKIVPTPQIQCLTYTDLKDYLGHCLLNIDNELVICQGIDVWIQEHKEKDVAEMMDLFNCLRLEDLSVDQLSEVLSGHLCKQCNSLREKLEMCIKNKLKNEAKPKRRAIPEILCILKNESQQLMVTESGEMVSPKSHLCAVTVNDINEANLSEITTAPWEGRKNGAIGYRVCVIGPCVYVFGGELSLGSGRWIDEVWEYDTLKRLWRTVCSLPSPRRHHSLAVHQNEVYISGGFGRHRILLNSVLKFSLTQGTFEELEPLPSTMYNCCSIVHDNRLFVFKSSILCLDLSQPSCWSTYTLPSQIDHYITSVCMFQGIMYLGYCNEEGFLCEVNPVTYGCSVTGKFDSYKKACVQKIRDGDSKTAEEHLVLVGEEQLTVLDVQHGQLTVKRKLDFRGLENSLEYCVLTIPDYGTG